ncbi:MAG: DJ-1/PfpI family protein [Bacteroidia bacterium]|nr:DJ-1/PfpI family protein [Bacteroidia bacterium]
MNQITVHLAEGFEEIEAVTIIDVLRRAGLNVVTVSITGNRIVKGSHNIEMNADLLFDEVDYTKGGMIILPGGMPGSKNLNEHVGLKSQIIEYQKNGKYLAAICAAPIVFGNLGILKGKRAVCYPGYEAHLIGAKVLNVPYIVDDLIITGRGVGTALKFSLEIVRILVGEERAIL